MAEFVSNYEKACSDWCQRLARIPLWEICDRVPELRDMGSFFTITHFGRVYRIEKDSFAISSLDGEKAGVEARLNIYTLLWYCKKGAKNTGEWVPFRKLPLASVFEAAFLQGVLKPLAETFAGMSERLQEAGLCLGGLPLQSADAGFQLNAFSCMPMRFLFWDGDEEFPPSANILYDKNAAEFIHPESLVTLAMEGMRQLVLKAEVPTKGSGFVMM